MSQQPTGKTLDDLSNAKPVDPEVEDQEDGIVDLAQAEATLIYQETAIKGPAWLKEAAQSRANFAQRLPGTSDWTIGNGPGSLANLTPEEREKKQREDELEQLNDFVDRIEEVEQREREEWERSQHSYFGADMTGKQWGELGDELHKDGKVRKWLIEQLMRQGKTKAEAEAKATEMADVYKILEKPESQRTDEENAKVAAAKVDPDYTKNTPALQKFMATGISPDAATQAVAANTDRASSVAARLNALDSPAPESTAGAQQGVAPTPLGRPTSVAKLSDGDGSFSTAPDLTAHHHAATAATEPLDSPKIALSQSSKLEVASAAPMPKASAGLDV